MNKLFSIQKGDDLPKEVTNLIGTRILVREGDKREEGICLGAKKVPQHIVNMETGERRRGVKYFFKPDGATRAKWTGIFPYGEPINS